MYRQIVVVGDEATHETRLSSALEKINSKSGKIISCSTVNGNPKYTRDGRVYKKSFCTVIIYEVDN